MCTEAAGGIPQPRGPNSFLCTGLGSARDAVSRGHLRDWARRRALARRERWTRTFGARCSRRLLIAPGATTCLQSCRRLAFRCVRKALVSKPGGVLPFVRREQDECHEALKVTSGPPAGANGALEQRQQRHRQHDAAVDHAPCQVCRSS